MLNRLWNVIKFVILSIMIVLYVVGTMTLIVPLVSYIVFGVDFWWDFADDYILTLW